MTVCTRPIHVIHGSDVPPLPILYMGEGDGHGGPSVGRGDEQDVLISAMRQEVAFIADKWMSVCA
ncbi:MAG: hypothetical protein V1874_03660 [Spirochaetota bacterium]